jgi:hypothetical protein
MTTTGFKLTCEQSFVSGSAFCAQTLQLIKIRPKKISFFIIVNFSESRARLVCDLDAYRPESPVTNFDSAFFWR